MIKEISKKIKNILLPTFNDKEEVLVKTLLNNSQKPIYHIHIRKTAGTTINFAFLNNADNNNVEIFYKALAEKYNHRLIANNKVFVGWNKKLINSQQYSYAFSHIPLHQLAFSEDVFLFTCLRNPVNRVISHYNMLKFYKNNNVKHACMKTEGKWLGNSLEDFIKNMPKKHLLNQLYMFSRSFNPDEAIKRILKLDMVLFTENLEEGLKELEVKTNWNLPVSNQKSYGNKELINDFELELLKESLKEEIKMYTVVKDKISMSNNINL